MVPTRTRFWRVYGGAKISYNFSNSFGYEEAGEIHVAAEGPIVMDQQLVVFVGLKRGEEHAQHNGDGQTVDQVFAVVFMRQCVVRPRHGTARQQ